MGADAPTSKQARHTLKVFVSYWFMLVRGEDSTTASPLPLWYCPLIQKRVCHGKRPGKWHCSHVGWVSGHKSCDPSSRPDIKIKQQPLETQTKDLKLEVTYSECFVIGSTEQFGLSWSLHSLKTIDYSHMTCDNNRERSWVGMNSIIYSKYTELAEPASSPPDSKVSTSHTWRKSKVGCYSTHKVLCT